LRGEVPVSCSEHSFDVVQPYRLTGLVEDDSHRVKAELLSAGTVDGLRQPGAGKAPQPSLLCGPKSLQWRDGAAIEPARGAASLHLDEDERSTVEHNEIDLPVTRTVIAGDELEAERAKVGERELLPGATEPAARVRAAGSVAGRG
jgi:hypothetical protein